MAEVFGVLASVFPGRVDLGLGRAGGPAHDYPQRVRAVRVLLGLDDEGPATGKEENTVPAALPRMWLLGAGLNSGVTTGELGSDYDFAHFLVPGAARAALASYRAAYAEHTGRPAPGGVLAVRVVTAESEDQAEALAQSVLLWRSRRDLGENLPLGRHRHRPQTRGRRRSSTHGASGCGVRSWMPERGSGLFWPRLRWTSWPGAGSRPARHDAGSGPPRGRRPHHLSRWS